MNIDKGMKNTKLKQVKKILDDKSDDQNEDVFSLINENKKAKFKKKSIEINTNDLNIYIIFRLPVVMIF